MFKIFENIIEDLSLVGKAQANLMIINVKIYLYPELHMI